MSKKLSLEATLKLLAPFLAADKKPEDVKAALMAAADALPESAEKAKAVADKRAADRKARDEKRAADRKARDEAQEKEDKAKDAKIAADRAARDAKFGEDRDDDPEGTNDADVMKACDADMEKEAKDEKEVEDSDMDPSDPSTAAHGGKSEKPALDSAAVTKLVSDAVATEREAGKALRIALDKVAPVLGKVTFDSAPEAYRAALTKLAVDHKGVADTALPALLDAATRAPTQAAPLAQDAASADAVAKLIPNLNRL